MPSILLFVHYKEEFEQSECVVLPWRNQFQEYDDAQLLDEIIAEPDTMSANIMKESFCDYKIREA